MNPARRVSFHTLGCRLNQAESALIAEKFRARGWTLAEHGAVVDVAVIHTCTVTERADARCRHEIRKVRKQAPHALVCAIGCLAQSEPETVAALGGVDLVVGNERKYDLPDLVEAYGLARDEGGGVTAARVEAGTCHDNLGAGNVEDNVEGAGAGNSAGHSAGNVEGSGGGNVAGNFEGAGAGNSAGHSADNVEGSGGETGAGKVEGAGAGNSAGHSADNVEGSGGETGAGNVEGNSAGNSAAPATRARRPAIHVDIRPDGFRADYPVAGLYTHTTRANLKVQDGCDFVCAYCLLPRVRGRARSRPPDAILAEARELVRRGHRELVVTGVNIGTYRHEAWGLGRVVRALDAIEGVARIRISSIEPTTIEDEVLDWMATSPRACRHLHVPLQSGDDTILETMRRPYRSADYAAFIQRAKGQDARPGAGHGRDRGSSGRDRGQLPAHRGLPGVAALHLPARVLVLPAEKDFGRARGGVRGSWRDQGPLGRAPGPGRGPEARLHRVACGPGGGGCCWRPWTRTGSGRASPATTSGWACHRKPAARTSRSGSGGAGRARPCRGPGGGANRLIGCDPTSRVDE